MNHLPDIAGWPVVRRVIATVALGSLLAGCSLLAEPTPIMNYTCGTVPAEACHEQAQKVEATAGGVVRSVAITCSARDCTRAWGEGDAAATLADGTIFHARWSYSGDPNPPPTPICIGLARNICTQRVQELTEDVSPSHHITSVTVTCTRTCVADSGDVTVVFLSEGGLKDEIGTTWGDPQP